MQTEIEAIIHVEGNASFESFGTYIKNLLVFRVVHQEFDQTKKEKDGKGKEREGEKEKTKAKKESERKKEARKSKFPVIS